MPWFSEGQDPLDPTNANQLRSPQGPGEQPDPFSPGPSGPQTVAAAFRQANPVVSVLNAIGQSAPGGEPDGHNPIEIIGGMNSKYAQGPNGLSPFLGFDNASQVRARMAKFDQEQADKKTLEASGWGGTVAELAAGALDPTFFLFPELKGLSTLAAARKSAVFGAVQGGVSQAAMQASNTTITPADSAFTIGSNTVLMGLLGAAHGALSTRERAQGSHLLDAVRAEHASDVEAAARSGIRAEVEGLPEGAPLRDAASAALGETPIRDAAHAEELARASIDRPDILTRLHEVADAEGKVAIERAASEAGTVIEPRVAQVADDAGLGGSGLGSSAGAAETDTRLLEPKPIPGLTSVLDAVKNVPYLGSVTEGARALATNLSPGMRIFFKGTTAARRAAADIAETAIRFKGADEGVTTAFKGPALESTYRVQKARFEIAARDALQESWQAHYFGEGAKPSIRDNAGAAFDSLRGNVPEGKLDYKSFKEAVFDAMIQGDRHEVPEVQAAAQALRKEVYEPITQLAQKTKDLDGRPLLSPDAGPPAGDESFANRVWNKVAVTARRFDLKNKITDWLEREQAEKALIKEKLLALNESHNRYTDNLEKLDGRLKTVDAREADTQARISERELAERQAGRRIETIDQQNADRRESLSQLEEFISTVRAEARDPESIAHLRDLEKQAAKLKRDLAPMSEAEGKRLDRADVASVFPGDARLGARMYLGMVGRGKTRTFLDYVRHLGGLSEEAGLALGEKAIAKKFVKAGGNGLDEIGEHLQQEFPERFPNRPTENEVGDFIHEAARGRDPSFFAEQAESDDAKRGAARAYADSLDEFLKDHKGEPKTLSELAQAVLETHGQDTSRIKRIGEKFDAANEGGKVAGEAADRRAALASLETDLKRATNDRAKTTRKVAPGEAKQEEAARAQYGHNARGAILEERLETIAKERDLLNGLKTFSEGRANQVRAEIEDQIRAWKGNSTAEAVSALKSRDKASASRATDAPRLAAADKPVDRAVKNILASERDQPRSYHADRADEIIDRIQSSPDGRLKYDEGKTSDGFSNSSEGDYRGSLRGRDFAIPTSLIKDFVVRDVEHLVGAHIRTVLPDIMLTQRFGDVNLSNEFRKINEEYAAKITGATSETEAKALRKQQDADIRDLAAIRDRFRGIYGLPSDVTSRQFAAVSRDLRTLSSLSSLGGVALNSLADWGGSAAFRYGLGNVFRDQWTPYVKSLIGMSNTMTLSKQAAKEGLVGVEGTLGHLRHKLTDVLESDMPGNKFSRGAGWLNDKFMSINGQNLATDYAKAMAWNGAQAEFRRTLERIVGGTAKKTDLARMADANIPTSMYDRLHRQLQEHSIEASDGVRIADTASWTDKQARDVFEAAMSRETEINVVTPGISGKPLFLSKPVGALLGQFRGFTAAAHEKILISGLQQADGRVLEGMIASIALGSLSYRLSTWANGTPFSDRPQDIIKEALNRSSLTGWMGDANNSLSKVTGGVVDYNRLYGADKPLTRRADISALSDLLGPSVGKASGVIMAGGHAISGELTNQDTRAIRNAIWLQNLTGLRRLFDQVEQGTNDALGIKPREEKAPVYRQ